MTDVEAVAHLASQAQEQVAAMCGPPAPRAAKDVDVQDFIRAWDLSAGTPVVLARFSVCHMAE